MFLSVESMAHELTLHDCAGSAVCGGTARGFQERWCSVREAASLKSRGGMSYADCFAAAAAYLLDCPVLTGDREFTVAEAAGIAVEWL
jgi:hypothetical protein